MESWAAAQEKVKKQVSLAIVAANIHYAGSGPATANGFRKMRGLKEAAWEEMKQSTLDP